MFAPAEEEHDSILGNKILNVIAGSKMTSTPSSTIPSLEGIRSPLSVHVVIELVVGGLPKKHTKQVLVMSSANTLIGSTLSVTLIVASQSCEWAGGGSGRGRGVFNAAQSHMCASLSRLQLVAKH